MRKMRKIGKQKIGILIGIDTKFLISIQHNKESWCYGAIFHGNLLLLTLTEWNV